MADTQASHLITDSTSFSHHFNQTVNDLRSRIERISTASASADDRTDAVEHCLTEIARLANEVNDSSSFLPAYDQRTYSETVKALTNKLQAARSSSVPKQKFSFKSKPRFNASKKESSVVISQEPTRKLHQDSNAPLAVSHEPGDGSRESHSSLPVNNETDYRPSGLEERVQTASTPDSSQLRGTHHERQPLSAQLPGFSIVDCSNTYKSVPSTTNERPTSGTVMRISHSVVDLSAINQNGNALAGLTVKDIKSSLIVCGQVDGAIHMTNIVDSIIVMSSRQFRMHASSNTDIYLHTLSRPIIEDCRAIRFAPLAAAYMSPQDKLLQNHWMEVDDFKWLKHEQSPNWSILDPSDRISERVWQEVRRQGLINGGAEETLTAVGLSEL